MRACAPLPTTVLAHARDRAPLSSLSRPQRVSPCRGRGAPCVTAGAAPARGARPCTTPSAGRGGDERPLPALPSFLMLPGTALPAGSEPPSLLEEPVPAHLLGSTFLSAEFRRHVALIPLCGLLPLSPGKAPTRWAVAGEGGRGAGGPRVWSCGPTRVLCGIGPAGPWRVPGWGLRSLWERRAPTQGRGLRAELSNLTGCACISVGRERLGRCCRPAGGVGEGELLPRHRPARCWGSVKLQHRAGVTRGE